MVMLMRVVLRMVMLRMVLTMRVMLRTAMFHLSRCFRKLTLDMVVDEHLDDE